MNLLLAILGMLALASGAFGAEIADIAWDQSNLETLRSFDKAAVARFLNSGDLSPGLPQRWNGDEPDILRDFDIADFTWAKLFGNSRYQLVVVFEPLGSSVVNTIAIYDRVSSGNISEQSINGKAITLEDGQANRPYIPKAIQDLNGDGNGELIIPAQLGVGLSGAAPAAIWPRVYKLQNGKYVEASRDFAKFYDTKVLPELNSEIAATREAAAREAQSMPNATLLQRGWRQRLDTLIIARDKILRVIGRDPKAGVQQAREWVTGPDPDPFFAIQVFEDMRDDEGEEAARRALHREIEADMARMKHEAGSNAQH
ncbi:MAG: hypothetical protein ABSD31_11640 [Candidatus Binataceae bacterium]